MLVFMIVAAILLYAGLARHAGKGIRTEGSSSPGTGQPIPVGEVPVVAVEPLTWTGRHRPR